MEEVMDDTQDHEDLEYRKFAKDLTDRMKLHDDAEDLQKKSINDEKSEMRKYERFFQPMGIEKRELDQKNVCQFKWVSNVGAKKATCHIVCHPKDYQAVVRKQMIWELRLQRECNKLEKVCANRRLPVDRKSVRSDARKDAFDMKDLRASLPSKSVFEGREGLRRRICAKIPVQRQQQFRAWFEKLPDRGRGDTTADDRSPSEIDLENEIAALRRARKNRMESFLDAQKCCCVKQKETIQGKEKINAEVTQKTEAKTPLSRTDQCQQPTDGQLNFWTKFAKMYLGDDGQEEKQKESQHSGVGTERQSAEISTCKPKFDVERQNNEFADILSKATRGRKIPNVFESSPVIKLETYEEIDRRLSMEELMTKDSDWKTHRPRSKPASEVQKNGVSRLDSKRSWTTNFSVPPNCLDKKDANDNEHRTLVTEKSRQAHSEIPFREDGASGWDSNRNWTTDFSVSPDSCNKKDANNNEQRTTVTKKNRQNAMKLREICKLKIMNSRRGVVDKDVDERLMNSMMNLDKYCESIMNSTESGRKWMGRIRAHKELHASKKSVKGNCG